MSFEFLSRFIDIKTGFRIGKIKNDDFAIFQSGKNRKVYQESLAGIS